jgi:hypothetical protein
MKHRDLHGLLYLAPLVAAALLFAYLYHASRETVLNEIRAQAKGIAMAVAAAIPASEITAIQVPSDDQGEPYRRIQGIISEIARQNPDVLYAYVMRRSTRPDARTGDMEYVVDQATSDDDKDGRISEEEKSLPIGEPYDASALPALLQGWTQPAADAEITQDPPYPDSISGYAPIRNEIGDTMALVGTDIAARTVGSKLALVRIGNAVGFLAVAALIITLVRLYLQQSKLAHEREGLVSELREALANVRTLSGLLPICASCKKIRNDGGDWQKLETYVGQHSNAEFSHSICPECTRKLYPELQEH